MVIYALLFLLALIPAYIAKGKGYSFIRWWVYGFLCFIPAFICICLKEDLINHRKQKETETYRKYWEEQERWEEFQRRSQAEEQQKREQERQHWEEQKRYQEQNDEYRKDMQDSYVHSNGTFDFFRGCSNWEQVEKRYKKLQQAYHPDSGCGDAETAKELNMEFARMKQQYGK